jgi:hypothetical protein
MRLVGRVESTQTRLVGRVCLHEDFATGQILDGLDALGVSSTDDDSLPDV